MITDYLNNIFQRKRNIQFPHTNIIIFFPKEGYRNICLQMYFEKYYDRSIKQTTKNQTLQKAEVLNLLSETIKKGC